MYRNGALRSHYSCYCFYYLSWSVCHNVYLQKSVCHTLYLQQQVSRNVYLQWSVCHNVHLQYHNVCLQWSVCHNVNLQYHNIHLQWSVCHNIVCHNVYLQLSVCHNVHLQSSVCHNVYLQWSVCHNVHLQYHNVYLHPVCHNVYLQWSACHNIYLQWSVCNKYGPAMTGIGVSDTTKFTCNNQCITLFIIMLWPSWPAYWHWPVTTVSKHGTTVNLTSVKRQAVTHPVRAPVSANCTTCAATQALAIATVHVRAVLPLEAQHAVAGVVTLQVCAVCSGVGHAEVFVTLVNLRFAVRTCPEASQVECCSPWRWDSIIQLVFCHNPSHITAQQRERERERERERQRQRQRDRENSNSKTLFSKDCSLGSFRPV